MAFDLTATIAHSSQLRGESSKVQGVILEEISRVTGRLTMHAGAGVGDQSGPGAGSLVVTGAGTAGVVPLVTVLTSPALLTVTPETRRSERVR